MRFGKISRKIHRKFTKKLFGWISAIYFYDFIPAQLPLQTEKPSGSPLTEWRVVLPMVLLFLCTVLISAFSAGYIEPTDSSYFGAALSQQATTLDIHGQLVGKPRTPENKSNVQMSNSHPNVVN